MTRIRTYLLLGTGFIAILLIAAVYYNNSSNVITAGEKSTEQIETTSIASKEISDTLQDNNDTFQQTLLSDNGDENENNDTRQPQEMTQYDITMINSLIVKYYDVTKGLDVKLLHANTQEEIDHKINQLSRKKEIIQAYDNIHTFIKPGLIGDSYIAFITYDIKFKNIDTLVPGMSVLTVVKDEAEEYLVNISPNNEDLNQYIKQISEADDIKLFIEEVNSALSKAIEKDSSLKEFIEYLKETAA